MFKDKDFTRFKTEYCQKFFHLIENWFMQKVHRWILENIKQKSDQKQRHGIEEKLNNFKNNLIETAKQNCGNALKINVHDKKIKWRATETM